MARVTSLGLHTPCALPYCITEEILSDPPPPNSFTWTTGLPHEELLVTDDAVIWSQGGVIRRVFRYDQEKEPVVQAVLVWFPSDDPLDATDGAQNASGDEDGESGGYVTGSSEGNKRKPDWGDDLKAKKRVSTWSTKTRSYATQLGSFPKAHTGNGGAGGVGRVGAATEDGDDAEDESKTGRARALMVFLKSQAFVYFLSGTMHVMHLPFEIQCAVPAPHGLILQRKHVQSPPPPICPTGNSFAVRPPITPKDLPSLFTLTDPLSEPGLVMTTTNTPCTEDLMFISPSSELDAEQQDSLFGKMLASNPEVIFAVTYDSGRSQITVWQVRYVPQDKPVNTQRRTPSASGTLSRRRSSFGPGTGATTPVAGPGSVASTATLSAKPGRDSFGPSDISSLNVLGEDFETIGGRRSSRRVSSMMARADLSGNHDAGQRFSDVSGSLGASFGGPPAPQNTMILDDQPVDELLNELNMGSLGIGMDDLGSYDGEGLKQEILMHKLESFPCKFSEGSQSGMERSSRVFTLRDPPSVAAATVTGKESPGKKVVLFVMNRDEQSLTQLTFSIQVHSAVPKGYSRRSSAKYGAGAVTMGYTPVLADSQKRIDVLDAIKIQDGGAQKVLLLTDDGKFVLYSPWGCSMEIILPPTLARWNPNVVGENGSRRGSRKKDFARTLSTTPDTYRRLEYSEPGGRLTVVDGDGVGHRISITLSPRESATKSCLETLRVILGGSAGALAGEWIYAAWMAVSKWMLATSDPEAGLFPRDPRGVPPADEWKAFVITLFLLAVPVLPEPKPQSRRKSAFVRSTSMVAEREWEELASHEGDWGSAPEYLRNSPWKWMMEEQDEKMIKQSSSAAKGKGSLSAATSEGRLTNKFITDCISHARQFLKSPMGEAQKEFLSKPGSMEEIRRTGLAVSLVAFQLLREEWKLDIAMEGPSRRLCPVLCQVATWLGWTRWVEEYMLEDVEMAGWAYDDC
jgi:anaphase-promoting complex subunit 1